MIAQRHSEEEHKHGNLTLFIENVGSTMSGLLVWYTNTLVTTDRKSKISHADVDCIIHETL